MAENSPRENASYAEWLPLAHELADAAGVVIRQYFRSPSLDLDLKSDQSPVTVADREAERVMRAILMDRAPSHGILGEELGCSDTDLDLDQREWVWVLDPIDGTKAFLSGKPTFGTLIALVHRGVPVLGVIDQAVLHERWVGYKGGSTTLNGQPVRVRRIDNNTLESERLLPFIYVHATHPSMFQGSEADWEKFRNLERNCRQSIFGSDCYAYALLASGCIDLVVEADLKPWDFLALSPVVENAGGVFTDWNGQGISLKSDGRVIAAASQQIHEESIQYLRDGD
uniref:Histidinol-phosphatase n=1 Tax=Compsopogon caeruleus TaxID=31354 RepID=A0A7S1XF79_9RHOD|eukprot:CAMPEP_0184685034 /NCGR_PEP_ID=MMETSP0312-20130426/17442_1 /TAXON_ID=31354 /ORGANISM="Compsopogon coeruleus, Strain SAG 36.94" /LENGTH=283 /DNA_ID=CAMNT_0027138739 /DNA_START=69 /DNA_END=920 /DNA_ORIENTATION=-